MCVYICVFVLYILTFLRGCEARSQIIIITIVIMKTLGAANRTTGAYSDNVSSGWSETPQHTWRGGEHECETGREAENTDTRNTDRGAFVQKGL